MSVKLRVKRPDPTLRRFVKALEKYAAAHPRARIEAYRHTSVSIRVRIIDPDFEGRTRVEREDEIWPLFEDLPEDFVSQLSLLLLLTPQEARKSFASLEFDNPVPSRLS